MSPTLRSHTHLKATQSHAHTKAYKKVWLPNRTSDRILDDRKRTTKA